MKQVHAQKILRTGANIFLTGEPGAGKTHTINAYVKWLRAHRIEPAICASTGIAATHIGGSTIHSWAGIGISEYLSRHDLHAIAKRGTTTKRIKNKKVLIIDEVSMLSGAILDNVNAMCKLVKSSDEPFGGMQVICVGDFFQLPPVTHGEAKRFAFESAAWTEAEFTTCYISEQYRQDDSDFLSLLSAIRTGTLTSTHRNLLELRQMNAAETPTDIPHLHTHNRNVDRHNNRRLKELPGSYKTYSMSTKGSKQRIEVLQRGCLSPAELHLKKNATVMFTKNDPTGKYANGTLGTIHDFDLKSQLPIVKLRNNTKITVTPAEWTIQEDGSIKARIAQLPLRLAWAITVHKSQGMSMDEAVMDLSQVFEYGQGYVALSRIRRLSGLHLLGYNEQTFNIHPTVLDQDSLFRDESEYAETQTKKISDEDQSITQNKFIMSCGGTIEKMSEKEQEERKSAKKKSNKTPTRMITFDLWKQGKDVAKIAEERKLKITTVMGHIEELFVEDKISRDIIFERMVSPELKEALTEIQKAFTELDTELLTPIKVKLKDKYSFKDLRIARLLMQE